jgi:pimeloyl-ACP methyl ester carboxylesterase
MRTVSGVHYDFQGAGDSRIVFYMPRRYAGTLALGALLSATPTVHAQIAWGPCAFSAPEGARCAQYSVFEDRAARDGRRITLQLLLLPATGRSKAPDPVVLLAGGPGAANTAGGRGLAGSPLREGRDILLIDARGTGRSGALDCAFQSDHSTTGYLADFLPPAGVAECRKDLERRANLTQYHTENVVDDFDEVRAALGIRQVNLIGNSGGTRQALVWMRRHPGSVRSAILNGPVPTDARIPLTFARDAQDALDGVLADCAADTGCRQAYPSLEQDSRALPARLDTAPVTVRVSVAVGQAGEVRFTHFAYAQAIRYMLYSPVTARDLPRVITRAAAGDFLPLGEHAVRMQVGGGISNGFYLSNTCAEDVPFFTPREADSAAAGTYLGTYRSAQQRAACDLWPRGRLTRAFLEPVRSQVPVLIVVGQHDPVTPPRWGREIAGHLARVRLVVARGGGHGFAGLENAACIAEVRAAFLETLATSGPEPSCLATVRRPAFALP